MSGVQLILTILTCGKDNFRFAKLVLLLVTVMMLSHQVAFHNFSEKISWFIIPSYIESDTLSDVTKKFVYFVLANHQLKSPTDIHTFVSSTNCSAGAKSVAASILVLL